MTQLKASSSSCNVSAAPSVYLQDTQLNCAGKFGRSNSSATLRSLFRSERKSLLASDGVSDVDNLSPQACDIASIQRTESRSQPHRCDVVRGSLRRASGDSENNDVLKPVDKRRNVLSANAEVSLTRGQMPPKHSPPSMPDAKYGRQNKLSLQVHVDIDPGMRMKRLKVAHILWWSS